MEKSDYMLKSPCRKCKVRICDGKTDCRDNCDKFADFEEKKKKIYKERKMKNGFYE